MLIAGVVLPGDDDRLDREAVGIAGVGEQLARDVAVGTVARQPVVRPRSSKMPSTNGPVGTPSPSSAVSISSWRSMAQEIAWRTSLRLSGPRGAVQEEREVAHRRRAFEHERIGHLLDDRRVPHHAEAAPRRPAAPRASTAPRARPGWSRRRRTGRRPSSRRTRRARAAGPGSHSPNENGPVPLGSVATVPASIAVGRTRSPC